MQIKTLKISQETYPKLKHIVANLWNTGYSDAMKKGEEVDSPTALRRIRQAVESEGDSL